MKRAALLGWSALPIIGSIAMVGAVAARPYALPVERPVALKPHPDAPLVEAHCGGCHSLDYITTQPRDKPAVFWRDTVTKMVAIYGAPIGEADAARIAAYLASAYGRTE